MTTAESIIASYLMVREAIPATYAGFYWKDDKKLTNPVDILGKHWELPTVWWLIKPLLLWVGRDK